MELLISPQGRIRCVYGEDVHLSRLGALSIRRASHVEPTADGQWMADMAPVNGPLLGPFLTRAEALQAEQEWLTEYWLTPQLPATDQP